jgi:hypothetical protein
MEELDVLPIISEHCEACAKKALLIAGKILKNGKANRINLELVELGAKFHDMAKIVTIEELAPEKFGAPPATKEQIERWKKLRKKYGSDGHELQVLANIFRKKGFDDLADFLLSIGWTGNQVYLTGSLEVKIIHYADWSLQGSKDVNFEDRVDYCIDTYRNRWTKKPQIWWNQFKENELLLEKEILRLAE